MSGVIVKICGLSTAETIAAALDAGADWIGLVFFPKSPRHVSLAHAKELAALARGRAEVVALTVDADDATLDAIQAAARPSRFQLHGRETPERSAAIARRLGVPVMKAIGLSVPADLDVAAPYRDATDMILYDAKPPKGAVLPGGNGVPFDWTLLRGAPPPFILSGGLSPENVAEALRISGAAGVDVSSGVESSPGIKDPDLIESFIRSVRSASTRPVSTTDRENVSMRR